MACSDDAGTTASDGGDSSADAASEVGRDIQSVSDTGQGDTPDPADATDAVGDLGDVGVDALDATVDAADDLADGVDDTAVGDATADVPPDDASADVPDPCAEYVGLATPAEMADTPRDNVEAEVLAIEASGAFLAPGNVYQRILDDLTAIRAEHTEVAALFARFSAPDQLLMGFDDEGDAALEAETYDAWDCPNALYKIEDINVGFFVHLTFDARFDALQLATVYAALPNVEYAEPNGLFGDGNDVCAQINGTELRYVFVAGSGDCPAGCFEHDYFAFSTDQAGEVTVLGTWSNGPPPVELPDLTACLSHL